MTSQAEGLTQQSTEVAVRFASLDHKLRLDDYNFAHFRTKHLLMDAQATLNKRGLPPGVMAPDFVLPRVDGGELRLSACRGRPVLLHFGSFT